jgi:hypothetical protein
MEKPGGETCDGTFSDPSWLLRAGLVSGNSRRKRHFARELDNLRLESGGDVRYMGIT